MQQLFLCVHDISQLTATPTAFVRRPKGCALAPFDRQIRIRRKPDWLRQEVLRLKAHMPRAGCRAVAHTFNRLHPSVSVGKTFVADLIASHQLEIAQLRRQIRSAKPRTVAVNNTWAMDMTFFTDTQRINHAAIGIIDHGSRVALRLQVLTRRCSWTLLGHLCLAIAQHGRPRKLRTNNEAVLNSWLFNSFLKIVGIQHQTTQKHAPGKTAGSSACSARSSHCSGNSPFQVVVHCKARSMSSGFSTTTSGLTKTCTGSRQSNTFQGSGQQTFGNCRSRR